MTKIKFTRQADQPIEVDIELPRYSKHAMDLGTIFYKFDRDPRGFFVILAIHFSEDNDEKKTEFTIQTLKSNDLGRNGDYYLGNGEFVSSEKDWRMAVQRALEITGQFALSILPLRPHIVSIDYDALMASVLVTLSDGETYICPSEFKKLTASPLPVSEHLYQAITSNRKAKKL